MPGEQNPGHGKRTDDQPSDEVETRGLHERNREIQPRDEEERDVQKAGGGTRGESQGGAHTGRYGAAPDKAVSNRERKPRGEDKRD